MRGYIDNINALPVVSGSQPNDIHKFWQTLNYNVQSLETLGKLSGCLSMVHGVLDKLPGIKADFVNGKPGWQDWGFTELMRSLEEWKAIHPMEVSESANAYVLTALELSIMHRNAVATHRACTASKGITRPFAIVRQQLDAKQRQTVEWRRRRESVPSRCARQIEWRDL